MKKIILVTMIMVLGFNSMAFESGTLECTGTYLNDDDETVPLGYTLEITDQYISFYENGVLEGIYGIGLDWIQDGDSSYKIERTELSLKATFSEAPLSPQTQRPLYIDDHYKTVIELRESRVDGSIVSIKRASDPENHEDNYSRVDSCIRL